MLFETTSGPIAYDERGTGDTKSPGRLLRGEPLQVDELDRRPLSLGQAAEPPDERRTGARR